MIEGLSAMADFYAKLSGPKGTVILPLDAYNKQQADWFYMRDSLAEEGRKRRTAEQDALAFKARAEKDFDFINALASDIEADSANEDVKASAREIMERCKPYLKKEEA